MIGHLHAGGQSKREIARQLGRAPSTIGREMQRNSRPTRAWPGGYDAERADQLADRRRRWDCRFKMARQPDLQHYVRQHLAMGWSPAQIAGRLALLKHSMRISHESIYRFIEHCVAQKDYSWHVLLPRRKYYRGRRPRKGGAPVKTFENYVSIDQRPQEIAARQTPGHWEADLMAFNQNKTVLLITQERVSRKLAGGRQPNKGAKAVRRRMTRTLSAVPPHLRQSITYDNGTEFAQHHLINKDLTSSSYFCHTHSPWEKGGVENAIGRLRRYLPSKTPPSALTPKAICAAIRRYNNTPRKCLGYLTPNEVWSTQLASQTVALQP
ncbi:MAG: IS30 family transposase [Sphingomonadales bacterium]|nr:MAG: IS30 family transposase [Sphingomonadales bacterium]